MIGVQLPRLLKADDVASQTGIPLSRVYELARNGELPAVRFGRTVRFDPAVVAETIRNGGARVGEGQG